MYPRVSYIPDWSIDNNLYMSAAGDQLVHMVRATQPRAEVPSEWDDLNRASRKVCGPTWRRQSTQSQVEREAPPPIPSTIRSPRNAGKPWDGRRVGDPAPHTEPSAVAPGQP